MKIAIFLIIFQFVFLINSKSVRETVQSPSKQLHLHRVEYKPVEFTINYKLYGRRTALVSFNYTNYDSYDLYVFRIRYHGYDEYATSLTLLNRTQENSLKIREMLDANYIICVSLFSSTHSKDHPPLSSTGMCIDFTVGESHHVGGSRSNAGLLAPLLLSVAAFILIFIAVANFFTSVKWFEFLLNRSELLIRLKQENEKLNLYNKKVKGTRWKALQTETEVHAKAYCNKNFIDDENKNEFVEVYDHDGAIASIKTLSHLLNEKPWKFYDLSKSNCDLFSKC